MFLLLLLIPSQSILEAGELRGAGIVALTMVGRAEFVDGLLTIRDFRFAVRTEILRLLEDAGGLLVRRNLEAAAMPELSSTDDGIGLLIISLRLLRNSFLASWADFVVRNGLSLWSCDFEVETGAMVLLSSTDDHIGFLIISL